MLSFFEWHLRGGKQSHTMSVGAFETKAVLFTVRSPLWENSWMFPCMGSNKYIVAKAWKPEVGVTATKRHGNSRAHGICQTWMLEATDNISTQRHILILHVWHCNEMRGKRAFRHLLSVRKTSYSLHCLTRTNRFLKANEAAQIQNACCYNRSYNTEIFPFMWWNSVLTSEIISGPTANRDPVTCPRTLRQGACFPAESLLL